MNAFYISNFAMTYPVKTNVLFSSCRNFLRIWFPKILVIVLIQMKTLLMGTEIWQLAGARENYLIATMNYLTDRLGGKEAWR